MREFQNPSNGYRETVSGLSILWTFLCGFIYLAIRGVWTHAIAALALVLVAGSFTAGVGGVLVWIVYALFAPTISASNTLERGWEEVNQ